MFCKFCKKINLSFKENKSWVKKIYNEYLNAQAVNILKKSFSKFSFCKRKCLVYAVKKNKSIALAACLDFFSWIS